MTNLGYGITAVDINNSGQIVVDNYTNDSYVRNPDITSTQFTFTATAINNSGCVTGTWMDSTSAAYKGHGMLYISGGDVKDIGKLPNAYECHACDINDAGQVVGYSDVTGYNRAFIYTPGIGMKDINLDRNPVNGHFDSSII